jgi:hypothetical protein
MMEIGQYVRVAGVIRRLVSRVNTRGDWRLDREAAGRLTYNESEMVRSERPPVEPERTRKYWRH